MSSLKKVNYTLATGWNQVSFPMNEDGLLTIEKAEEVFSNSGITFTQFIGISEASIKVSGNWVGNISSLISTKGYWLYVTALPGGASLATVEVNYGTLIPPWNFVQKTEPIMYECKSGWNFVSFSSDNSNGAVFSNVFIGNESGTNIPFTKVFTVNKASGAVVAGTCLDNGTWVGSATTTTMPEGSGVWLWNDQDSTYNTTLWQAIQPKCVGGKTEDEYGPPDGFQNCMYRSQMPSQAFIWFNYPGQDFTANSLTDLVGDNFELGNHSLNGTRGHDWVGVFKEVSGLGNLWGDFQCTGSSPICEPHFGEHWPNESPSGQNEDWGIVCIMEADADVPNMWNSDGSDDSKQMRWLGYSKDCNSYFKFRWKNPAGTTIADTTMTFSYFKSQVLEPDGEGIGAATFWKVAPGWTAQMVDVDDTGGS